MKSWRVRTPVYRIGKLSEGLYLESQPEPTSLFQIKGELEGKRVSIARTSGAKARTDWESLTKDGAVGTLTFRHFSNGEWHTRSTYRRTA